MSSKIIGNAPEGFKNVAQKYGVDFARNLERLCRLETRHFMSSQWLKCGSAGMVAFDDKYPFGWSSLKEWVNKKGLNQDDFKTVYFSTTSDGKPRSYIRFPQTKYFVEFLAWFIQNKRNGNIYAWYSLDKEQQEQYKSKLDSITPKFI
ncbi:MAG: hypothetical protein ACK5B9_05235 [Flavobacteriia bacterium]